MLGAETEKEPHALWPKATCSSSSQAVFLKPAERVSPLLQEELGGESGAGTTQLKFHQALTESAPRSPVPLFHLINT